MQQFKLLILGLAYLLLQSGCSSTKPAEFFVLHHQSSQQEAIVGQASRGPLVLGIGPVTIPKLLDRPQIVTRLNGNAVKLAEYQRWAEPLKDNIIAVLTRNLAQLRPTDSVLSFPSPIEEKLDYRASIDVWQFEASSTEQVRLESVWVITNSKDNSVLHREHSIIMKDTTDASYDSLVNAMSAALHELSQKISARLEKVTR